MVAIDTATWITSLLTRLVHRYESFSGKVSAAVAALANNPGDKLSAGGNHRPDPLRDTSNHVLEGLSAPQTVFTG